MFKGLFESEKDVFNYFREEIDVNKIILYGNYTDEDYSGNAVVGGYDKTLKKFFIVYGSHCSCFGLEGQWDPEYYTRDEIKNLYNNILRNNYSFTSDNMLEEAYKILLNSEYKFFSDKKKFAQVKSVGNELRLVSGKKGTGKVLVAVNVIKTPESRDAARKIIIHVAKSENVTHVMWWQEVEQEWSIEEI